MEKIKQKPIERLKTVLIVLLVVSMLVLASLYIGGAQFFTNSAAMNSSDMPKGSVPVGNDIPKFASVFDKDLLAVSFIGIRCEDEGGGAYGSEPAARDLFDFAAEPLHSLLSSSATVSVSNMQEFEKALEGERYICMSFVSSLPYQIIYALTGEYTAPLGSNFAINPDTVLISFDMDRATSLYLICEDKVYVSKGDYFLRTSELLAMASDSRLNEFSAEGKIFVSETSPLVQTVSLSNAAVADTEGLNRILSLLDYGEEEDVTPEELMDYTAVAPHGTLSVADGRLVYSSASESGIPLSAFLDGSKSDLDIDMYDVLLSSVSLIESVRAAIPLASGSAFSLYLDGFYRKDDMYTVVFGICENGIPIFGDGLPYFAKITVQGGRLKEFEYRLISGELSGYAYSPFSSAWEYRYASLGADIKSMLLRYNIVSLPCDGMGAAWFYTGERTVAQ